MRRLLQLAVVLPLLLLILVPGCKRKKPPVPQPQTQAPTITVPSEPAPPPPVEAQPQPQPQPTNPPAATANTTVTKPGPKHAPKKKAAKKTAPKPETTTTTNNNNTNSNKKTVVHNGSTAEPSGQLSAGLSPDAATLQRHNTARLLTETDNNLRGVNRSLTSDEQEMVKQIRAYMQQSRTAEIDGDTERAYNLALKARLLSEELVKR